MMKVAIIALMLAIAALGLGGFATFAALNDDETPPIAAEPTWSSEECANARAVLSGSDEAGSILVRACLRDSECNPYIDLLQAINDNCP